MLALRNNLLGSVTAVGGTVVPVSILDGLATAINYSAPEFVLQDPTASLVEVGIWSIGILSSQRGESAPFLSVDFSLGFDGADFLEVKFGVLGLTGPLGTVLKPRLTIASSSLVAPFWSSSLSGNAGSTNTLFGEDRYFSAAILSAVGTATGAGAQTSPAAAPFSAFLTLGVSVNGTGTITGSVELV